MNKISITFLALLMFPVFGSNAQTGIGTNTPQAALDVSSSDSGILIPRLFLTGYNTFINAGTASTTDNSMMVYNTNTATNTGLNGTGYYYWNGGASGKWYKLNENIGPWKSNSSQYAINDLATYNGRIYTNLTGTNSSTTPNIDRTNWDSNANRIGTPTFVNLLRGDSVAFSSEFNIIFVTLYFGVSGLRYQNATLTIPRGVTHVFYNEPGNFGRYDNFVNERNYARVDVDWTTHRVTLTEIGFFSFDSSGNINNYQTRTAVDYRIRQVNGLK